MKKTELSSQKLKRLIELRKVGSNWKEIEREIVIDRRVVKRVYEEWERDNKIKDQKAARFRVVAEAFHEHLRDLVTLGTSFIENLDLPEFSCVETGYEKFFSQLLDMDLLKRDVAIANDLSEGEYALAQKIFQDKKSYRLEKELLFESLKVHTSEKIQWEHVFDDQWRKAKDNCANIMIELRKVTNEDINRRFEQKRHVNLLNIAKEVNEPNDPIEMIVEAILKSLWLDITQNVLNPKELGFEQVSSFNGNAHAVYPISRGRGMVISFPGDTGVKIAESITHICNLSFHKLCKKDITQQLNSEARMMEHIAEDLRRILNKTQLTPIILRTMCDLCPV